MWDLRRFISLDRLRNALTQAFIVALLSAMCIETLPFPSGMKAAINGVLDTLGISQGEWSMFAPEPDSQNHRLSAKVEYADGETLTWHSPDWSRQSNWTRFTRNRESEYIDAVWLSYNSAGWPPMADYLARSLRPEGKPVRVTLYAATDPIPSPEEAKWKIRSQTAFGEPEEFFSRVYP